MHEYRARTVYFLGVHLLYASMVWLAACALTSAVRSSATARYWMLAANPRSGAAADVLLLALSGAVTLLGVFETVAHTACCFAAR
jgi:hypothetical protein